MTGFLTTQENGLRLCHNIKQEVNWYLPGMDQVLRLLTDIKADVERLETAIDLDFFEQSYQGYIDDIKWVVIEYYRDF